MLHLRWSIYVAKLPGRTVFGKTLTEEWDDHRKQKLSKRELLQKIRENDKGKIKRNLVKPSD